MHSRWLDITSRREGEEEEKDAEIIRLLHTRGTGCCFSLSPADFSESAHVLIFQRLSDTALHKYTWFPFLSFILATASLPVDYLGWSWIRSIYLFSAESVEWFKFNFLSLSRSFFARWYDSCDAGFSASLLRVSFFIYPIILPMRPPFMVATFTLASGLSIIRDTRGTLNSGPAFPS